MNKMKLLKMQSKENNEFNKQNSNDLNNSKKIKFLFQSKENEKNDFS